MGSSQMVPEMFDFRGLRVSKIILYLSQLEVEAKTLELPDPSPHQRVMCAGWGSLFVKPWLPCL